MKEIFRGIIPPMITPLNDQDTLDTKGVERLIEHIIDGGVHGLFILGTTGEAPGLSYAIRKELIRRVCLQVDGRVPVLVGITDTSLAESIHLADYASEHGADAVVAAPPYYFKPNQQELKHYFETLAGRLPLPLFLYNMPSHTGVNIEAETVRQLSAHENIVGLKDSSANLIYFQKVLGLMKNRPEFSMLTGPEEILMQSVLSGGHGGVNGGANMFPGLYVEMYEAAVARNYDRMKTLQNRVMKISNTLYSVGDSPGSYLQGVKSALSILGICNDVMALPYNNHSKNEKETIRKAINQLNSEQLK